MSDKFIEISGRKRIPWIEYTQEHMDEDDYAIKKYFDKLEPKKEICDRVLTEEKEV